MGSSVMTLIFFLLSTFSSMVIAIEPGTAKLEGPPMSEFTGISAIQALAAISANAAIKGFVQNNCNFPIYVQYAHCCTAEERSRGLTCVDPLTTLDPHTNFWTSGVATNNRCSQTIRVFMEKNVRNVYQVEYSMDPEGDVWYNLSSVDGSPFEAYARFLEIEGRQCKWMYCKPGDPPAACDWPFHEGRCEAGNVKFYLC